MQDNNPVVSQVLKFESVISGNACIQPNAENLTALESLTLAAYHSDTMRFGASRNMPLLHTLVLRGCRIPDCMQFDRLPSLTRLVLESCDIMVGLHPTIGALGRLQVLHIERCYDLTTLPPEFAQLIALIELMLVEVPRPIVSDMHISGLSRLRTLTTDNIGNEQFPEALGQLANLRKWYIRDTNFKTRPPDLARRAVPFDSLRLTCDEYNACLDILADLTSLRELYMEGVVSRHPNGMSALSALMQLCFVYYDASETPLPFHLVSLRHLEVWLDAIDHSQKYCLAVKYGVLEIKKCPTTTVRTKNAHECLAE